MTPSIVLNAWERAQNLSGPERGVALLSMFRANDQLDALWTVPIAERDRTLLSGRVQLFGDDVETVAACEGCGERVELAFRISDVLPAGNPAPESSVVEVSDQRFLVRLPDSRDLISLRLIPQPAERAAALMESCVRYESGLPVASAGLGPEIREAVSREMEHRSPAADIRIGVSCPRCGKRWEALFDIATFLWEEIEAWAIRLLGEIHALASAYGWTEQQILALTPWRRTLYLKMVRGC